MTIHVSSVSTLSDGGFFATRAASAVSVIASNAPVSVVGITKRFKVGGPPAVLDASFVAAPGGITTLLGPSGSGKTTLLRIIAGLETANEGIVAFHGEDITNWPVRARGIGFVFQGFALFAHMTVRRNIAFGLEIRGASEPEKRDRVDELLSLVQLEGFGDRYPHELSGGQRQRVGFARALACRPKVLLLDEPFGALDARVRVELRDWLIRLHETTQLTTLLVTHDQEEALELSQKIVVMNAGRVAQMGTPSEIYDHPASPFVAAFVGSANILRGAVTGRTARLGALSVSLPSGSPEGAEVQAIVRPHNVRVERNAANNAGNTTATVTRLIGLGAFVKIHLSLSATQDITVQLSRGQADELHLAVGDQVIVDLTDAKVFVGDYSI